MAKTQKKTTKSKGRKDVINLNKEDFESKNFKAIPAGTYFFKISPKSSIKPGTKGNNLNVQATVTKGEHKGANVFDTIAPSVGWKVAQLLNALGIKKMTLTLQELLKLVMGKDLRAIVRVEKYQGKKQNKVVQWLPLEVAEDEEEDESDEDEDEDAEEDSDEEDSDDDSDDEDDSEDDDDDDSNDDDEDEDDESDDEDEEDAEEDDEDSDEDDDEDEDADDDEEEEDDEEDEAPVVKKPTRAEKRAASKKKAAPAPAAKKKTAAKKAPAKKTPARGKKK